MVVAVVWGGEPPSAVAPVHGLTVFGGALHSLRGLSLALSYFAAFRFNFLDIFSRLARRNG